LERVAITTALAPAKLAITSQAIRAGSLIFTAGVMPLDAESQSLPPGGVAAETHQAMRNLRALLEAAGSSLDRLVQVTIYLKDWGDFAEMNAVYVSYLTPPYPARACVEVSHIGDDAALEIVAIALAGGLEAESNSGVLAARSGHA
jgi:2-iminobutanoate/2-iminopropanoate deaminase